MLRADLQALRNLARTAEGRKVLAAQAVVLACAAAASLGAHSFLAHPAVAEALRADATGAATALVYGLLTLAPVTLVLALGMSSLGRELFLGSHAPLLLATPVSSFRIVLRAFARTWFGWSVTGLAVAVPPALALSVRGGPPLAPVLGVAVTAPVLIAPVVAVLALVKVVLVRWCSGPRLRLVVLVAQVALAVAAVLALLSGFVRGEEIADRLAARLAPRADASPAIPALLLLPGVLPAALAGFAQPPAAWTFLPACLALPALVLPAAAGLYRRSFEAHLLAGSRRALRARSRNWPVDPVRSLCAKARAESVRVRGNLAFFGFLCVLLVGWLAAGGVEPLPDGAAPRAVLEAFAVLHPWQGLSFFMAAILFLTVIGDEQKQISLLATAPVSRRDVLRAKRLVLGWPFAATLFLAALAAPLVRGVSALGTLAFALAAAPVLLATLGCLLAIGSWPFLIRVHDDTPLANNLRSALPVLFVAAAGVAGLFATAEARSFLVQSYQSDGSDAHPWTAACLAAAWLVGLAAYWAGGRIARGNFERLLGPQEE